MPPSCAWKFLVPEFFWNTQGVLRILSALWDKKNSTENSDTALFAWSIEVSGGIDVCKKPLKTKFKTVIHF